MSRVPFVSASLRILLWSMISLAALVGTTVIIAGLLALLRQSDWSEPDNLTGGLVCGLIVWLFLAAFHLRKETITLPVADRSLFLEKTRCLLYEMGYEVITRTKNGLKTRPCFTALLLGPGIEVTTDGDVADLTGPKVCLEILRNRWRWQNQIDQAHQAYIEEQSIGERLLKRVQLHLRVAPRDLEAVRTHVIDVLAKEAEVICDIHVLAHSILGVRESVVETQVRPWLTEQGLTFDIHKDHIQMLAPGGLEENMEDTLPVLARLQETV